MTIRFIAATVLVGIAALAPPPSSAQPDKIDAFTGKWTGDPKANAEVIASGLIPTGPQTLTIVRAGETLTVARNEGAATVYRLDGSESESTWDKRPATTRLSWKTDTLILEARLGAAARTMTLTRTGDRLTVVNASSRASGPPREFTLHYLRTQ